MLKRICYWLVVLVVGYGLLKVNPAMAVWYVDGRGNLVNQPGGQVLGDDDEGKQGEEDRGDEDQEDERDEEDEQQNESEFFDAARGAYTKTKTEGNKTKTEIKNLTGEEVKVETEDGRMEIDYEGDDDNKMKLKNENGVIKIETEDGELDLDDDLVVTEREDKYQVRVSTASGRTMRFSRNNRTATTDLPISVDLDTNELVITTAKRKQGSDGSTGSSSG